jgi:hypothetical protein
MDSIKKLEKGGIYEAERSIKGIEKRRRVKK